MAGENQMKITTHHCICAQLALAHFGSDSTLSSAPKRKKDNASIHPIIPSSTNPAAPPPPDSVTLSPSTSIDDEATVLKLDDGFEKRYFVRCGRCGLRWGYFLDENSYDDGKGGQGRRESVVFLLEGGLVETGEVREGKVEVGAG